jgi:drug/metabolite transporter (DMT)-like permease
MEKLFAVLGMLANAGKDTVFKVAAGEEAARPGSGSITLFYALKGGMIAVLAFLILVVITRAPLFHPVSLWYSLPIGACTYVTYMLALRSLVQGDASVNVTTYRLNFVVSSVIAVLFLGETLSARKIIGMILCIAAIAVFFLGTRAGGERRVRNTGLPFALLACLFMALLNTLNKLALNAGASIMHLVMYRYILVCAIGGVVLALRRQSAVPSRKLLVTSGACAVLMLAGIFFVLTALQASEITLVIPISQLSFLFTALLAFLFLKEKMNLMKAAGILMAVVSIAVIG